MSDFPSVDYPTIIEGLVCGDTIRFESLTGNSLTITGAMTRFYPELLPETFPGVTFDGMDFHLKNAGPFTRKADGEVFGVTHLQKYSSAGYLKAEPDCFHWWRFWKKQQNVDGVWIPGTEQGLYIRKSRVLFQLKCWRWDVAGTPIDGTLRHWIRSGGYFGGHWD